MKVIHDTPLIDISQDTLGRELIIDSIVDSINSLITTDHPCTVYGIYGKWGSGKTSMMNFVKNRLLAQGDTDKISIVEFNPWLVNNEEALLREYFNSILTYPDKQVCEFLTKYGSLAILASKTIINTIVPRVGSALGSGLELVAQAINDNRDTLSELKKKASDAIHKSGHHLLVLIDDIDRLDKTEQHAVMRLIRQVADFPNCIYLVAMDVEMVSKAIGSYYGAGGIQDGREFIDKIVQVPITLPQIPLADLKEIVKKEMHVILHNYTDDENLSVIVERITPFIRTYRDIKRYCNQIRFVLPNLENEVNITDLCILEMIKIVSATSYDRIYDRKSQLLHEIDSIWYFQDKDKETEEKTKRYLEAKDYIVQGISGQIKRAVYEAIDELFIDDSTYHLEDLDKKRICTNEYFDKYFSLIVPSNIIPDRLIDSLADLVIQSQTEDLTTKFDNWLISYQFSEVKRASLRLIRSFSFGKEQSHAASVIAKALSTCQFSKVPSDQTQNRLIDIASFVPVSIIQPYMFVQMEDVAGVRVWDEKELDNTLDFIFRKAEISFCMSMLYSSDIVFKTGSYNGRRVLPIIFNRFKGLGFDKQYSYSKHELITLYYYWKLTDGDSFSIYAKDLFSNPGFSYLNVLDKLIDGRDDANDCSMFVRLFTSQIPFINELIEKDRAQEAPFEHHSVKVYSSNYRLILEGAESIKHFI